MRVSGGISLLCAAAGLVARFWFWLGAYLHFNEKAVCELSEGMLPEADFHDWWDGKANQPWHFFLHECRRCGKKFTI